MTKPCSPRQPAQAIALEDTGYSGSGYLDVMVEGQTPDDAHRTQLVRLAEIEYIHDNLSRRAVLWVLSDRFLPKEAFLTIPFKRRLPSADSSPANANVPAGPANMPGLLGMH